MVSEKDKRMGIGDCRRGKESTQIKQEYEDCIFRTCAAQSGDCLESEIIRRHSSGINNLRLQLAWI